MTRVLIVDDHGLFREGIRSLLGREEGVEVVGEAGRGDEALRLMQRLRPDIAFVDVSMPGLGGVQLLEEARKMGLATAVVILSMHSDAAVVNTALAAGARGYVLKDDSFDEVAAALETVAAGGVYISPVVAGSLAGDRDDGVEPLSRREKEILGLISAGMTNREIARHLCISVKTVETHRARIMRKTGLHNTAELTRYAINTGVALAGNTVFT